jgi:hypothetical protein
MRRTGIWLVSLALLVLPAAAQQAVVIERPMVPAPTDQVGQQIRISVALNMFVPGPLGTTEQMLQAQERARRAMYEMAVRECTVLREVIANECRIEAVTINISRHPGQQPDGFSVGGNFSFRVTLK